MPLSDDSMFLAPEMPSRSWPQPRDRRAGPVSNPVSTDTWYVVGVRWGSAMTALRLVRSAAGGSQTKDCRMLERVPQLSWGMNAHVDVIARLRATRVILYDAPNGRLMLLKFYEMLPAELRPLVCVVTDLGIDLTVTEWHSRLGIESHRLFSSPDALFRFV